MAIHKQALCNVKNLYLVRKSKERLFELKINDFTFDSHVDSKIPFVGRSGEGKSTLLEALATMLMPESGQITWRFYEDKEEVATFTWGEHQELSASDISLLRTQYFGFSFQDTTLTPSLTVLENLIYPQLLSKCQRDASTHAQCLLSKFFTRTHEKIATQFPQQLSGGQRQRVALLQAMVNDPFVLFADEPTGNLDAETRKIVMQVIEQWQQETGGMFIWVTHHESDISDNNKYLHVDQGISRIIDNTTMGNDERNEKDTNDEQKATQNKSHNMACL